MTTSSCPTPGLPIITLSCPQCGATYSDTLRNYKARNARSSLQEVCKGCRKERFKKIASETMAATNRTHASARMKTRNPMRIDAVREAMAKTLRAIGHKPSIRGGNGMGLTRPQAALLASLGHEWVAEYVVPTGVRTKERPPHYKLDLAHPRQMIAIEVDGLSHCARARKDQDARKDAWLRANGWTVLRVSNAEALRLSAFDASTILRSLGFTATSQTAS